MDGASLPATANISARPVAALDFPDLPRAGIPDWMPEVRLADPASLVVDEGYQRGLSDRSIRLIRKIVAEWSWLAFKPPIVVDVGGILHVIDGQHTAIGAVTHGGIPVIPVLVVRAEALAQRASAFVRHNRDRIQVTATQLHAALVAAGDEDALTMAQVCDRAGVKLLKNPPPMARFKPGECMAVTTIQAVISRRHAKGAREVLETCVKGGAAPVGAVLIRAVEHLMFDKEYKGQIEPERISALISAMPDQIESEAKRFAAERKVPLWRAMASVLFMNRRKARV
ncbi:MULTISPECIES: DUF6551 family protein [unclassified Rhizobium]|uniref:DUF6551 family protein n=1 Tax=unclassified Rhizobium TaxID=2613769 RepID=UPI0017D01E92|nr:MULTISPECIES: DUF6551 family protein [unclassified Rhizobium]MBB3297865.1 hypothetical protein [Rhizobium sp. BK112]MBB4177640.1 hypothetical protein [Rhizobium sp. BK109]